MLSNHYTYFNGKGFMSPESEDWVQRLAVSWAEQNELSVPITSDWEATSRNLDLALEENTQQRHYPQHLR